MDVRIQSIHFDASEQLQAFIQKKVSKLEKYYEDIKQLQEFAQEEYGKFDPLEVEAELIREWIVSLMDKGYTSTSVNRKLSSLRTFYKYLIRQGETTIDPLRKIKGPKNKKPLPVFLKENEMNRLLDDTDFGQGFKGLSLIHI